MQIEINLTDNTFHYALTFGCFLVENDFQYMFCNLAFDLGKKPEAEKYLKSVGHSVTVKELDSHLPGGYFVVVYSKKNNGITCYRDLSGLKSGYYAFDKQKLVIGTNCHKVAKQGNVKTLNKEVTDLLLATEYVIDGYTIYEGVKEFLVGTKSTLNVKNEFIVKEQNELLLADQDNILSYEENRNSLKDKIFAAHSKLVGESNIIYLSGGIDSCVMLAALDEVADKSKIQNISYRVKGTDQDETYYAKEAAKYLGYDCEIIDVDPTKEQILENFVEKILEMNNPYYGMFIFMPDKERIGTHYFAGQDTRLHTPDINFIDHFAFNQIVKGNLAKGNKKLVDNTLLKIYGANLHNSPNKVIKNLDRIFSVLSPDTYLHYFFLKANKHKISNMGLTNVDYLLLDEFYTLDFNNVKNKRDLFNKIVEKKWKEQYTDDIRYMQDMVAINHGYMQMPFYDIDLSRFSSSIPFEQTIKFTEGRDKFSNDKVKVNKVLLREAFADKLSPEVIYRKKAVSLTVFLLFNGALGKVVKDYITKDVKREDSLIKEFGYEEFIEKFQKSKRWQMSDQTYLLRIYYLFVLILLREQL